jgi:two-component system alkaline phosphatase synthesis response regulator PhoP
MSKTAKKKVLIVDDEPTVIKLLRRLLGKHYVVIEASDGEEAVLMATSQRPDLILMDIMMPRMDGYHSCYAIKKDPETRAIPVVMLTAINQPLNVKLGEMMGADGYITKPFNSEELLSTIDKLTAARPPKARSPKKGKQDRGLTRRRSLPKAVMPHSPGRDEYG